MANRTYELGLVEVADGVHAYLQPNGSWGWSNSRSIRWYRSTNGRNRTLSPPMIAIISGMP